MVWASISADHRTPLVIIDGTLMARRYIDEVLEPTYLLFRNDHLEIRILQQDNAHPHTAWVTTAFLEENNFDVLP